MTLWYKCETGGIKYKYCKCSLEYTNFKNDLIEYKCSIFSNSCQIKFDEKLKECFFNTYRFSNHDNNKFILLLRKGIYLYECMDDRIKFNEMRRHNLKKKTFIVTQVWKILQMMQITRTQKEFVKTLKYKFRSKVIYYC